DRDQRVPRAQQHRRPRPDRPAALRRRPPGALGHGGGRPPGRRPVDRVPLPADARAGGVPPRGRPGRLPARHEGAGAGAPGAAQPRPDRPRRAGDARPHRPLPPDRAAHAQGGADHHLPGAGGVAPAVAAPVLRARHGARPERRRVGPGAAGLAARGRGALAAGRRAAAALHRCDHHRPGGVRAPAGDDPGAGVRGDLRGGRRRRGRDRGARLPLAGAGGRGDQRGADPVAGDPGGPRDDRRGGHRDRGAAQRAGGPADV
ncbi:MAG: Transcriptional regulator, IclR family, partial [uncultured Quadrisphaera sp.]